MANQEQFSILKQGVKVWNEWREINPTETIDLIGTNLSNINLSGANFSYAKLKGTSFSNADLRKTDFDNAELYMINFNNANLNEANLSNAYIYESHCNEADLSKAFLFNSRLQGTDFIKTNFCGANLVRTEIEDAKFVQADLSSANLSGAWLNGVNLEGAKLLKSNFNSASLNYVKLGGADLNEAIVGDTTFRNIDFSNSNNLETVKHFMSSTIGNNSITLSKGKIPKVFLRGCGLSDWEIELIKLYDSTLTNQGMDEILYKVHDIRARQPIQISPLFISYSHADSNFVNRMEKALDERGVRFWRDIHHVTAGKLENQIDRAISQNPTVLVVLSKNSINSDWVQHEVRKARELEKDIGRDVLCPIALDDSWKTSTWPERIMEQVMEYNILDFSDWSDEGMFGRMFVRLIDGLNLYYRKEAAS